MWLQSCQVLPKTEVGTDVQMGTVDLILKFKKLRLREVGQYGGGL